MEHSKFTIDNEYTKLEWREQEPLDEREQLVEARRRPTRHRYRHRNQTNPLFPSPSCTRQFCSLRSHGLIPQFVFLLGSRSKTPPDVISSGKLFARSLFAWKIVLRLLEPLFAMSTTICFTLPHPALQKDTLFLLRPLRRIPLFNSSPRLFGELQQFCYHQYEHQHQKTKQE
jgi:hypothetical protein